MGLKSGSRDADLDEDADDATTDDPDDAAADAGTAGDDGSEAVDTDVDGGDDRPTMDSIPYKLRRSKVNEGRDQIPFFLREEVVADEDHLQDRLEDDLGEQVYKSDYREAAMVVAQRNPDLVAAVLREWGYDLR